MIRIRSISLAFVAGLVGFFVAQAVLATVLPPTVITVYSRKVHGAAGTFDLPLASIPLDPTTEPRVGPAHTIVFVFNKTVTGGIATVTEGTATVGTPTFSGSEMTVPLTAVANQQYVTVTVSNVTAADGGTGGGALIRVGFLAADVGQNRTVTISDLLQLNARLAQNLSAANYLGDVNVSGTLTLADMVLTNAQLTTSLPPPSNSQTWNGVCPGFSATRIITLNWANPVRSYTVNVGGFSTNDALVVRFTTGTGDSSSGNLPKVGGAEFQTTPSARYATLSETPCDFGPQPMAGASTSGFSVTIPFALGNGYNYGYYPSLKNNTTYYFNIKNLPNPSCGNTGNCDMFVELIKPPGL